MPGNPHDLRRTGLVAQDEQIRGAPVHQAESHARVLRVDDRSLALDPEELSPTLGALDHELLGGAREEVGDDRIDRDPPARDHDPRLPRRYEHRGDSSLTRRLVELERDGHLPDRAVRSYGQDGRCLDLEVRAGRHRETLGRPPQVAKIYAVLAREGSEIRIVRDEDVHPRLDVQSRFDRIAEDSLPRRRKPPALRRDGSGRRPASSSRNAGRRRSPQRGSGTASWTPRPAASGGSWTPSSNGTPGQGSSARRRLPSRSTWSQRLAICAPAEIARPDSTIQPSMTPRPSARAATAIRTASRMPPLFASLMLTPCARSAQAATSPSVWQSSST